MSIGARRFLFQEKKRDLNERNNPHLASQLRVNLVDNWVLNIKQVNQKFKVVGNCYKIIYRKIKGIRQRKIVEETN